MNLTELETKTKDELMEVAKELDIGGANGLRKQDLVFKIMQAKAESEGNYFAGGILDMANDGYGFLRTQGMRPSISDVYVSQTQIRRFALRVGDYVVGIVRPPKDSEKYFGLVRVDAVNGLDPEVAKRRPYFEQLTPIFPDEMVTLEEASHYQGVLLVPGAIGGIATGIALWAQLDYGLITTGWLVALEVLYVLTLLVCLPLIGIGLRRARIAALQARRLGRATPQQEAAMADAVPLVFGGIATLLVPVMAALSVFRP